MFNKLSLAFLVLLIASCAGTQKVIQAPPIDDTEYRQLEEMVITAPRVTEEEKYELPDYKPQATRKHDLLHTSLDVRFDWAKQQVLGKATLTLKPYFYTTNILVLDAKGYDVHQVALVQGGSKKDLKYDYDQKQLTIDLGRDYKSTEEYKVFIDYTAKPSEIASGGSFAITQEQGLYFINPLGDDPEKPQQIWTQGETESNSCWFPTIDKPNERCTQDIKITVENKFKTLSNGLLKSSTPNSDGTRTDYWEMDLPHAPYLFMLTVGEFAVVKDSWDGMLLEYWVEPEYEASAKGIYGNTAEMLTFFSDKMGVKYPWQKYSQVIVRDFVSGAMENTTGVIFYDQIQKTNRELIDNNNDRIVAHELFHHWFGDLVTCESWSNLALNESFANYGEYLWLEHKYGRDEAERHRLNEISGYKQQAQSNRHPLIFFEVEDKEDMFDAHSYNKGGAILHMLRNYVGDDAFFASLNRYLTKNEYTDVEAHELRLAFEDVTGEDMNWFFNQWFFDGGHPSLVIGHEYDELRKEVRVTIEQNQETENNVAVYQLPIAIDVHIGKRPVERHNVMVNQRKQTFTFPAGAKPDLVSVDADRMLLCDLEEPNKTEAEYVFQYHNTGQFWDRIGALDMLKDSNSDAAKGLFKAAVDDKHWSVRRFAINNCSNLPDVVDKLAVLAKEDKYSQVRAAALRGLGKIGNPKYVSAAKHAIDNDEAYPVLAAGLDALYSLDKLQALEYAAKLEKESNSTILIAIGNMYAETGDVKRMAFFENSWEKINDFSVFPFFEGYTKLLIAADAATANSGVSKLKAVATDASQFQWRRLTASKSIVDFRTALREQLSECAESEKAGYESRIAALTPILEAIKSKEKSPQLLRFYEQF